MGGEDENMNQRPGMYRTPKDLISGIFNLLLAVAIVVVAVVLVGVGLFAIGRAIVHGDSAVVVAGRLSLAAVLVFVAYSLSCDMRDNDLPLADKIIQGILAGMCACGAIGVLLVV